MKTITTSRLKIFLFFLIGFSLVSCNLNSIYTNREEDKNEAEKVTNQFYDLIKQSDYTKTYELFSSQFFSVTDTEKLNTLYKAANEKLGPIESMTLDRWETNIVTGTKERGNYALQYIVKHKNSDSKETITLTKENGQIKITGYNITTDALFAPENK